MANEIVEVTERYDDIDACKADLSTPNKKCRVKVKIDEKMKEPVFLYYQLENFYQNHRSFVKSRSEKQLRGEDLSVDELNTCEPVTEVEDLYVKTNLNGKQLSKGDAANPCGLTARSVFNDTYTLYDINENKIDIKETGIAWESDLDYKFIAPDDQNEIQWIDVEDEHFVVWMRIAAMPTFRKLWGIIEEDLDEGTYYVDVLVNYDVSDWDGKKSIVFSTANELGGRNFFLGMTYLIAGGVCILSAGIFLIINAVKKQPDASDPSTIKWD